MSRLLPLLPALAACSPVFSNALALGPRAPARPADCAIQFDLAPPQVSDERWHQVGVVCLAGPGTVAVDDAYSPGDLRESLQARACELGGDAVAPLGFCSVENASGVAYFRGVETAIQFAVFRKAEADRREESPAGPGDSAASSAQAKPAPPDPGALCAEADSYQARAAAADGPVRSALQRIAETKSRQCTEARNARAPSP